MLILRQLVLLIFLCSLSLASLASAKGGRFWRIKDQCVSENLNRLWYHLDYLNHQLQTVKLLLAKEDQAKATICFSVGETLAFSKVIGQSGRWLTEDYQDNAEFSQALKALDKNESRYRQLCLVADKFKSSDFESFVPSYKEAMIGLYKSSRALIIFPALKVKCSFSQAKKIQYKDEDSFGPAGAMSCLDGISQ